MRTFKFVLAVLLVEFVALVLGFFIIVLSGVYDVSATKPHFAVTRWVFGLTMDRSVEHHAAGITVPERYASADRAEGYEHFDRMCVQCHGAPGVERGMVGKGLNPVPPDLAEAAEEWSASEIYWVVKHGVKMTGMPAFEPTHTEEQLWTIAAFVKGLEHMTPEQYQAMRTAPVLGSP